MISQPYYQKYHKLQITLKLIILWICFFVYWHCLLLKRTLTWSKQATLFHPISLIPDLKKVFVVTRSWTIFLTLAPNSVNKLLSFSIQSMKNTKFVFKLRHLMKMALKNSYFNIKVRLKDIEVKVFKAVLAWVLLLLYVVASLLLLLLQVASNIVAGFWRNAER